MGDGERRRFIKQLMQARLAAASAETTDEQQQARALVHAAKVALGEQGPPWWDGDGQDYGGQHPSDTPYAGWWQSLPDESRWLGE